MCGFFKNVSSRAEAPLRRDKNLQCHPERRWRFAAGVEGFAVCRSCEHVRTSLPITACILLVALLLPRALHAAELANLRNGFSLRAEHHEVLGSITRLYMSADPSDGYVDVPTADIESFQPAPPSPQDATAAAKPRDLNSIVNAASNQQQVDADFIASVIRAESAGNPRAVSPKGAQGLMQLMPKTACLLGVKNSFDPEDNIDGGVRYLRALLLYYNNDMVKALAAYNAGPQRVQQYHGVPPYRETRAYVARVIKDYNRKKLAERKHRQASAHRVPTSQTTLAQTTATSAGGDK